MANREVSSGFSFVKCKTTLRLTSFSCLPAFENFSANNNNGPRTFQ